MHKTPCNKSCKPKCEKHLIAFCTDCVSTNEKYERRTNQHFISLFSPQLESYVLQTTTGPELLQFTVHVEMFCIVSSKLEVRTCLKICEICKYMKLCAVCKNDEQANQSSDILHHSQNRPTGDRWLKF